MQFDACHISGAWTIRPTPHSDDRGRFMRSWCQREFQSHGIEFLPVQANMGYSKRKGTLRGLHYQVAPALEAKLVRCTRGSVFDVLVDLRPDSATYLQWYGTTLSADNGHMLFVPELCGHGCVSLEDQSEISYQTSAYYAPECARGIRFDDPAIGIEWPIDIAIASDQDRSWPLLSINSAANRMRGTPS